MNKFNYDIELIENYLDNSLDEKEKSRVDDLLRTDKKFRELFTDMETLMQGIRRSAESSTLEEKLERLRESMEDEEGEEDEEEYNSSGKQIFIFYWSTYKRAIAAAITLIIVATAVWMNVDSVRTPQELYAEFYSPFDVVPPATRGDSEIQNAKQRAFQAYDGKNYSEAIVEFEKILEQESNEALMLYLGNAYMMENNFEKAKEMFKEIIDQKAALITHAKWYLSLCYLKEGNKVEASKYLKDVKESSLDNRTKAVEILDELH